MPKRRFCVVDNGLFCDFATRLARDKQTEKVDYWMPWKSAFSQRNQLKVGEGLEGVTRIQDWEPLVDDKDICWAFPDVNFPEMQLMLQDLGRRVWGSRRGEQLELYRVKAKKHLAKLGLTIGPYEVVKGIGPLRDYLKTHKDVWVKGSLTRGDFESFKSEDYQLVECVLDKIEHDLGMDAETAEFVVEESIPDACEIAIDTYSVDGKFPSKGAVGIEAKAKAYLCHFLPSVQWPKPLVEINDKLSPDLKRWYYRNFVAIETRITKGRTAYVLDPAMRFGSPPSELLQSATTNIADIVWEGGAGNLVEPVFAGKWGAELIVYSSWAEENHQAISFPENLRPWIALRYASKIKGYYYVRPQPMKLSHVGSVSAVGDTAEEAMDRCKKYSKEIKGHGIEVYESELDSAYSCWKSLPKYGMKL